MPDNDKEMLTLADGLLGFDLASVPVDSEWCVYPVSSEFEVYPVIVKYYDNLSDNNKKIFTSNISTASQEIRNKE
jgi:hypothetical protein